MYTSFFQIRAVLGKTPSNNNSRANNSGNNGGNRNPPVRISLCCA
jgi:hypothetical protein